MPVRRLIPVVAVFTAAACAGAAARSDVRTPLGAYLSPSASTGAQVPLRFDSASSARLIRSTAATLPPAAYAPMQAERGEAVFERRCARCHESSEFIGQKFVESWNDRRLYDFYAVVRSTMPLNDPGSLKDEEYLGVLAYLLRENHAAAGADSLRADTTALRSRKIAVRLP